MIINWNTFAVNILIAELFALIALFFLIPIHRLYLFSQSKKEENSKREITKFIIESLVGKGESHSIDTLKKYKGSYHLLTSLEAFNHRLKGQEWEELKNKINTTYLLPKARKWANKRSWIRKNFAARVFVLTPLKEDEQTIFDLAKHPDFLVNSFASHAALEFENQKAVIQTIRHMSKEKGYGRLYYCNLFAKMSYQVFNWIKALAENENDPKIHLACLEILSQKAIVIIPDYIKRDQESDDPKIRRNAAKIIAGSPHKDTLRLLDRSIKDPDGHVRAEALTGYFYFPVDTSFEKLEHLLHDQSSEVSIRAAQTLSKMGTQGIEILKKQKPNTHLDAYEAAQLALQYNGR